MSTSPIMAANRQSWDRPFVAGYSCQTAFFVSTQLLLWAHAFAAVETELPTKLSVLFYANMTALVTVLLGFVAVVPYVRSTFQEKDVVVDGGPSLITDLIPQALANIALFAVIILVSIADQVTAVYMRIHSVTIAIYLVTGLAGLCVAIASLTDHKERVLVSTTVIAIAIQQPAWFSDWELMGPVAFAVLMSGYFDAVTVKVNQTVLRPLEVELLRIMIVFKLVLFLALAFTAASEVGILVIVAIVACNCAMYVQERRFGSITQRDYLRLVPVRRPVDLNAYV